MQSTPWKKDTVIQFLEANGNFKSFIDGGIAGIHYRLDGVDFLIYRNDVSVEFYYPAPYNPTLDYSPVESFFIECRPILSKMVRDAADKRLISKK